jgi:hypothetical protein
LGEIFQGGEFASHISSANESSNRPSAYDFWFYSGLGQSFDDTDVRPPAGCAATKRKTDARIAH